MAIGRTENPQSQWMRCSVALSEVHGRVWMDGPQLDKAWMRAMRHLCELKQRAQLPGCARAELLAHQKVTVKLVRMNRQLKRLAHLKRLAQARVSASIVVCVVTGRFILVSSAPFTTLPLLSSGIPWGAGATTEAVRRRCSCTVGHGACAVGDDRSSDSGSRSSAALSQDVHVSLCATCELKLSASSMFCS
jgi:hypothetical protein